MSFGQNQPRNPGPNWGIDFIVWAEHWWPRWFFRPMLMIGTWVGLAFMPAQRAHSREYLAIALGRPPRLIDVWRHFFAFTDFLVLKLRAAQGAPVACNLQPGGGPAFDALLDSGRPALFGTFHFGGSDLLGYLLAERGRRVSIIRLRVGNSGDTRVLGRRYEDRVSFLWVNEPAEVPFAVKAAVERGESLALQCDRLEFSAKNAAFYFLGARRMFPIAIYYLSILFHQPVAFCIAIPAGEKAGEFSVYASPVFLPDPAASRDSNLQNGRVHFQTVLTRLDALVRQYPFQWFNFIPLNPVADDGQ